MRVTVNLNILLSGSVGPYEMGARKDGFLPNAMKTLFRLSRVLLGL